MSTVQKLELNADTVTLMEEVVNKTFTTMTGVKFFTGGHSFHDSFVARADISGIVNISQEDNEGSLILSLPKETAFGLLSKIFRRDITALDATTRSGVGELTNILFGVFKKELSEKGHTIRMALPSVIVGEGHEVAMQIPNKTLVMPFHSTSGNLTLIISIAPEEMIKSHSKLPGDHR